MNQTTDGRNLVGAAMASLTLATSLASSTASAGVVNDWTDPSLYANGAPVDQMLYTDRASSNLGAQRVIGDGGVLQSVSFIFGKGNTSGELNAGDFSQLNYGVWLGTTADFDPTSSSFDSHFIKTFSTPTTIEGAGNVGGIDLYKLTFSDLNNATLASGSEYLISVAPFGVGSNQETIALAMYADTGAAAIGSLTDYQFTPYSGTTPLDSSEWGPGWNKFAASAVTVVPEPASGMAALAVIGGALMLRKRR